MAMVLLLSGCMFLNAPDNNETISVEGVYSMAKDAGYTGTLEDFINEFKGENGLDGKDGVGIKSAEINASGHLVITLTDKTKIDAGRVVPETDVESLAPTIGENGNWFVNGKDTGVSAGGSKTEGEGNEDAVWHSGSGNPGVGLGKNGDFFFSTSNSGIYIKNNGVWTCVGTFEDRTPISNSDGMSVAAKNRALLSAVHIRCGGSTAGSGVIYRLNKTTGDAYVITNYHVVYNSSTSNIYSNSAIKLYLYGMENIANYAINASYVGGSAKYDIAVLKVMGSNVIKESNAVAANFADSNGVHPLDYVVAVGNSQGDGIATTVGHINKESEEVKANVGSYVNITTRVMRIDAAVNEGNSGGGLFNINGDVIGIVNAKQIDVKVDNVAYAIPSNLAVAVAENIIYFCNGVDSLSPKSYDIGINEGLFSSKTEFDENGMVTVRKHIGVFSVDIMSLADDSELASGDIIKSVTIDGAEYEIRHELQLEEVLLYARPGGTVKVNVMRGGSQRSFTLNMPPKSQFTNIF